MCVCVCVCVCVFLFACVCSRGHSTRVYKSPVSFPLAHTHECTHARTHAHTLIFFSGIKRRESHVQQMEGSCSHDPTGRGAEKVVTCDTPLSHSTLITTSVVSRGLAIGFVLSWLLEFILSCFFFFGEGGGGGGAGRGGGLPFFPLACRVAC